MQQKVSIIPNEKLWIFCLHQFCKFIFKIVKIMYDFFYSYEPSYLQTSSMTQPSFCLCEVS